MRGGIRLAVLTGVALLVGGCGGDALGEVIDAAPTLAPVVEERALWDSTGADAVSTVVGAALRGDTAVIAADERDHYRLAVVDAATGKPRWSIDERDPLPGGNGAVLFRPVLTEPIVLVAGPPDDFLVFVPYHRDDCAHPTGWCPREDGETYRAEQGVAALSGRDGSVRWMKPIIPLDQTRHKIMKLLAAGEDLLLIGSTDVDDYLGGLRTFALSTSDGHELWRRHGMEAYFITGDTVIAHTPTNPDQALTAGVGLTEGTVVALDAMSGERRWDLGLRFADSDTLLVADDLVVVNGRRGEDDLGSTLVLEATTGHEVANLGVSVNCASDTRSLIACADPMNDHALVTFHVDERTVRVSRRSVGSNKLRAVWHGRVFLEEWVAAEQPARHTVVDRSANVLDERELGRIVTISDRYAIFQTGEERDISVHAVKP